MEQYFQFTGLDYQKMLDQVKPQAMKQIQSRLVLEAIVKAEGITATDAEYEEEIARMAEMYQMEVDKVKEALGPDAEKQIKEDLAVSKAVDLIVAESKEGTAAKAKKAKTEEEEAAKPKTTKKAAAKKTEE